MPRSFFSNSRFLPPAREGNVFSLSVHGGGGYPSQACSWGGYPWIGQCIPPLPQDRTGYPPDRTWTSLPPPIGQGGTQSPPTTGQGVSRHPWTGQGVSLPADRLRRRRYAFCGHAGGLSSYFGKLKWESIWWHLALLTSELSITPSTANEWKLKFCIRNTVRQYPYILVFLRN